MQAFTTRPEIQGTFGVVASTHWLGTATGMATLERGEAHGLEILRRLEETGCGLLRLKEGSLYPALYRLEAAGDVKAVWEDEPHGRRGARRRIYRLTAKGQRKLNAGRV